MHNKYHQQILQKITGLSKEQLFLKYNPPIPLRVLSPQGRKKYREYEERLESWEPIEYILEKAEFYGLDFFVDSRVLIPRNDTEIMVESVIEMSPHSISPIGREEAQIIYVDIWTGSACVPVSIIKNSEQNFEKAYAIDISQKALEVAEINIQKHDLEDKINLFQWDLLEPVIPLLNKEGLGVVITANLPYIKQDDFENMDDAVYLHEPNLALYWWKKTGFELYEKLIWQCQELQKAWNKITLFIELGFDQKDVCESFLESQWLDYEIFKDNGGVERCVWIKIN